jgi:hypothetical protein
MVVPSTEHYFQNNFASLDLPQHGELWPSKDDESPTMGLLDTDELLRQVNGRGFPYRYTSKKTAAAFSGQTGGVSWKLDLAQGVCFRDAGPPRRRRISEMGSCRAALAEVNPLGNRHDALVKHDEEGLGSSGDV